MNSLHASPGNIYGSLFMHKCINTTSILAISSDLMNFTIYAFTLQIIMAKMAGGPKPRGDGARDDDD